MEQKRDFISFLANSSFVHTILSIILGFIVGGLFLIPLGIPVIGAKGAYTQLWSSISKNLQSWSYCIVYGTPYIVIGLAIAFAFKTGVFNIGAEGQYVVGSISACVVAIIFKELPQYILIPFCMIAAMLAGAIWAIIVGWLKTKFGVNEILSMIMFNWIAFYLSNYIVENPIIKSEGTAEASKNISQNAMMFNEQWNRSVGLSPYANWGIFLAIILVIIIHIIIEKTTLGYELKAVGYNKHAAQYGGINVNQSVLVALAISGALCGLGGCLQLLGRGIRIPIFSGQEGYGFNGIVVSLMGMNNPFGVFLSGLFFGALKYGGQSLNLIGAPTQVVDLIIGTVIFFISIATIFSYIKYLKKPNSKKGGEA